MSWSYSLLCASVIIISPAVHLAVCFRSLGSAITIHDIYQWVSLFLDGPLSRHQLQAPGEYGNWSFDANMYGGHAQPPKSLPSNTSLSAYKKLDADLAVTSQPSAAIGVEQSFSVWQTTTRPAAGRTK